MAYLSPSLPDSYYDRWAEDVMEDRIEERDCYACGGDGWLPSLPEGNSDCPYCNGTGIIKVRIKNA